MNTRFLSLFALLFTFTFISACDSTDVEDDDHEEHADVEGLMLRANGATLVTVDEGEVSGSISVPLGDETSLIFVQFMNHDGETVTIDDPEFSLGYAIGNTSTIEWEQHEGEDYEFHLKGLSAGTTTLTLELLHGDHADFKTPAISVVVE
ncbi:MAG: hypothetical protein AAF730_01690 [Bacteroidota bacterium]